MLERKAGRFCCNVRGWETMKGLMASKEEARMETDSEVRPVRISVGRTVSQGF